MKRQYLRREGILFSGLGSRGFEPPSTGWLSCLLLLQSAPFFVLFVIARKINRSSVSFLFKCNPTLPGFSNKIRKAPFQMARFPKRFQLLDFFPDSFFFRVVHFGVKNIPAVRKKEFEQKTHSKPCFFFTCSSVQTFRFPSLISLSI